MGKGSRRRPEDSAKYRARYVGINWSMTSVPSPPEPDTWNKAAGFERGDVLYARRKGNPHARKP
jgi:hypothetical protein